MAKREKVLWVVTYANLDAFLQRAVAVGATAVAIRTDNDLAKAIPAFQQAGIKVYGWRWPSAQRAAALQEAQHVVALYQLGLDGYYVDPEGAPGQPWDWNQPGLEQLAEDFCQAITSAAPGKPFGVTSHYRANQAFANLPWATFFRHATVLLPQAYWQSSEGRIGDGNPADNYKAALANWSRAGAAPSLIVPMAGELACSTADQIAAYTAQAGAANISDLHFYTHQDGIPDSVWTALAKA